MVGSALLVKPVTEQGASHVDAYLPPGRWYEVHGPAPLTHDSRGQRVRAKAPIEGTAPLFQPVYINQPVRRAHPTILR